MRNEWTDRIEMKAEIERLTQERDKLKEQNEAFATKLETELKEAEKIAYQGYEEAYQEIVKLQKRCESLSKNPEISEGFRKAADLEASCPIGVGASILTDAPFSINNYAGLTIEEALEKQKQFLTSEFGKQLDEGYEEAYQMLEEQRKKNNTLEVDLYNEFDKQIEFLVGKIDQFLAIQSHKMAEAAQNPDEKKYFELLEAWRKATPSEIIVEEATGVVQPTEDKKLIRRLEAKNIRLEVQNAKFREAALQAQRREKEIREKFGLPDTPIMEDILKSGLLGSLGENYPTDGEFKPTKEQLAQAISFGPKSED